MITDIQVSRIHEDGISDKIPVKSLFFSQNGESINLVIKNLLSREESCRDFFYISITFYENKESCVVGDVFEINKTKNGLLEIRPRTPESANIFLAIIFNDFFENIYMKYDDFSIVPTNKILIDKFFVNIFKKTKLTNYFKDHEGLKQTVDSLNAHLSQIRKLEDISVQLKKFFDERRECLIQLNKGFSAWRGGEKYCFDVDRDFCFMMVDILIFLENCTNVDCCFEFEFLLRYQNISAKIKEVKVFVIPNTFFKKKCSALLIRIFPENDLYQYYEKEIWFFEKKLYVSHDFCNICCEKKWYLKVFNDKEKSKTMTLELFKS
jgi:hypothetical protein